MEELKTAETNEEVNTVGSDADAGQNAETVNELEFTDTPEEDVEGKEREAQDKQQTKAQNVENARRRREAERQRAIKEAREQAIIQTLKGVNPYTNEKMVDSEDVAEYLMMREIEDKGGDPLADFSKFSKAQKREQAAETQKEEERADWFRKDREEFISKYPDINIDELIQDKHFQSFASGKVGMLPLAVIYESYSGLRAEFEKKAKGMAKQMLANQKASPGALASPGTNDSGFYTPEQVKKMSQKEVRDNYEKIRASMSKWKF